MKSKNLEIKYDMKFLKNKKRSGYPERLYQMLVFILIICYSPL